MDNPPSPVELRNYIHRLQNSREIRNNKKNPRNLLRMADPPSSPTPTPSPSRGMPCRDTSTPLDQIGLLSQVKPSNDPHTPYREQTLTPVIGAGYCDTEPVIVPTPIDAHRGWWPKCHLRPRSLRSSPAGRQPPSHRVILPPCTRTPIKISTAPLILPRETEWAPEFIWGKLQ